MISPLQSEVCWHPSWASTLESSWSLLRKFAFLNAALACDLRLFFGSGKHKRSTAHWKFARRSDLRVLTGIDNRLLATTLMIPYKSLAATTVIPFIREGELDVLTSSFLRFCPFCLQRNFHSPLFQNLLIHTCPIHAERLTLRCQYCESENIPYTIDTVAFRAVTGCEKCVQDLDTALPGVTQFEGCKDASTLQQLAAKLRQRAKANLVHCRIDYFIPDSASAAWKLRRIDQLSQCWDSLFQFDSNANATCQSLDNSASVLCLDLHKKKSALRQPGSATHGKNHDVNHELFLVYKSLRRHLVDALKSHRKCVCIAAALAHAYPGVRMVRGRICPFANLFLLWRMHWENVDRPCKLLPGYRRRSRVFTPDLRLPFVPSSLKIPNQLLTRVFLYECLGVLDECRLLSFRLHRQGFYSFNLAHLKLTRTPYWILSQPDPDRFSLRAWIKPKGPAGGPLDRLKYIAGSVKSCDPTALYLKSQ